MRAFILRIGDFTPQKTLITTFVSFVCDSKLLFFFTHMDFSCTSYCFVWSSPKLLLFVITHPADLCSVGFSWWPVVMSHHSAISKKYSHIFRGSPGVYWWLCNPSCWYCGILEWLGVRESSIISRVCTIPGVLSDAVCKPENAMTPWLSTP